MSIDKAIDSSIAIYMTRFEALNAALASAGSQAAFARALDVAQPTVWRWVNQTKQLPAEYVLRAEVATGVSRHDLRPDIYPREHMIDAKAGLHCDLATRQNGFVPHHDCQNNDRFVGVDFNRRNETKAAAR